MRVLIVMLTLLSMPVFAADPHAQHRATAATAADHGDSLFHLDAEWTDHREDTRFVLVSFDTVTDTPDRLRTYAASHAVDDARWYFLSGERAQVRALAMLLGVQFHDTGNGMFDHSNLITVLDRDGRIAHRVEGLMQPMDAAAAALAR